MAGTPPNALAQRFSGAPIATDGERIILGEPGIARLFTDAAYVFERDANGQYEAARLSFDGFTTRFGTSVAIRGDRLAISVEEEERTLIFDRIGDTWIKSSEINSGDPELHDRWDKYLQWIGDDVLVSSALLPDSGVVYVRNWNGATWDETVLTSNDEPSVWFGYHFAATESLIVASDPGVAEGGAYVFRLTHAGWVQEAKLVPADACCWAGLRRVAISGTTVMMPYEPTRGGARDLAIFKHDDSKGIWEETQTLPDVSRLVVSDGKWAAYTADDGSGVKLLERDPSTELWEESVTLTPSRLVGDLSLSGNLLVAGLRGGNGSNPPYQTDVFVLDTLTGEWAFDITLSGTLRPEPITGSRLECINGLVGPFPCDRVDLLAFVPTEALGGLTKWATGDQALYRLFNVWGWTHKDTGREFALVAREDATAFIEVTGADQGIAPVLVGELPAVPECGGCARRHLYSDVKVFDHYAFVSGYQDSREMKVFDLNRLIDPASDVGPACDPSTHRTNRPRCFAQDAEFRDGMGEPVISGAFNLSIDQETGFAYAIGAQRFVSTPVCEGTDSKDLFIIDIRDPLHPTAAGCYKDPAVEAFNAQCVVYKGPDADYSNKEICFVSAKTALQIVDVTDKLNPLLIASVAHADVGFINHGSLSSDHARFLMADDWDELFVPGVNRTRTIIWDVSDLDSPVELSSYFGRSAATDYQLYVDEGLAFVGNSNAGITVLDVNDPSIPVELGWFDTVPATDEPGHNGGWSVYPFLPSGNVLVSSRDQGLFVLRPTAAPVATVNEAVPESFWLHQNYPNPFNAPTEVAFSLPLSGIVRINVYDMLGREVSQLVNQHLPAGHHTVTWEAGNLPSGVYLYRLSSPHGSSSRVATLLR